MIFRHGTLGIAVVAIGAYVAWHARTGGGQQVLASPATAHLPVGIVPGHGVPTARWAPQGAAQPTQGQLKTAGPFPGQAGPASGRNQQPGFVTVPGASCPDTSTDGILIPRTTIASQAWANKWGVHPNDTLRAAGTRGVPYP